MKVTSALWPLASAFICSFLFSSCASRPPVEVDHSAYTKTPDSASSKVWRGMAKSIPGVSQAAFYGNWGGSGNQGGAPIDILDEAFRRHDIVYYESRCGKHLKAADSALVQWLKQVDEEGLTEDGRLYRKRAIRFMESPMANLVGKPPMVMLRKRERVDCYFQSPEVVENFFRLDHPGFPWADPLSTSKQSE